MSWGCRFPLDAVKLMRAIREVNFAIAFDRLKRFLEANKAATIADTSGDELCPVDIADRMQKCGFRMKTRGERGCIAVPHVQRLFRLSSGRMLKSLLPDSC
jgi:hypothetical protein